MGAVIAPSISERLFLFSPYHFLALLASSPPGRRLIDDLVNGDWEQAQEGLPDVLASLFLTNSVTLGILGTILLLQTVWHKRRREGWLVVERERLAAKDRHAAEQSRHAAKESLRGGDPVFDHRCATQLCHGDKIMCCLV
jgi:hypothetical protein